jgi:hypothetical protein
VCAFLIHPEKVLSLFLGVDEELTERRVQESDRNILTVRNTENRVQEVELTLDLPLWNLKQPGKRHSRERAFEHNNTADHFSESLKPRLLLVFLLLTKQLVEHREVRPI